MDVLEIIREYGFSGGAVIVLGYVIWWLIKWIRELIDARQADAERFADRGLEREREMISTMKDMTNAIRTWTDRGRSNDNDR